MFITLTKEEIIKILKKDDEEIVEMILEFEEEKLKAYKQGFEDAQNYTLNRVTYTHEEILKNIPNTSPKALELSLRIEGNRQKAYEQGYKDALKKLKNECKELKQELYDLKTRQSVFSTLIEVAYFGLETLTESKDYKQIVENILFALNDYVKLQVELTTKKEEEEYTNAQKSKKQYIYSEVYNMEFNITKKYQKKPVMVEAYRTDKEMIIHTLEGDMKASVGDYIITGVEGEQYPCKPDIFEKTYQELQ